MLSGFYFLDATEHGQLLFLGFLGSAYVGLSHQYKTHWVPQQIDNLETVIGPRLSTAWLISALSTPLPKLTYLNTDRDKDDMNYRLFIQQVTERAHALAQYLPAYTIAFFTESSYKNAKGEGVIISTVNTYVNQLLEHIWKETKRDPWILRKPLRQFTTPALLILSLYTYIIIQKNPFDNCDAIRQLEGRCTAKTAGIQPPNPNGLLRYINPTNKTIQALVNVQHNVQNVNDRNIPCFQIRRFVAQDKPDPLSAPRLRRLENWLSNLTEPELTNFFAEEYNFKDADAIAKVYYARMNPPPQTPKDAESEWSDLFSLQELEYLLLAWAVKRMNLKNRTLGAQNLWNIGPMYPDNYSVTTNL
jgi:hypothetical protein